ncbi:MAG: DUF1559 domain-containing protein [Planctomycetes bacterium]|nr:DUF1559 domain-containing protein [Planctomycetota bacterium]
MKKKTTYNMVTGFTLVELLVIITVITVLAALLLPALNQAINMARCTACQSNMKQLALATSMYASDNNGCQPTASTAFPINTLTWGTSTNTSGTAYVSWYSALFIGKYIGNDRISAGGGYGNYQRGCDSLVVYCPVLKDSIAANDSNPGNGNTGIGLNVFFGNNGTSLFKVNKPSIMGLFADAQQNSSPSPAWDKVTYDDNGVALDSSGVNRSTKPHNSYRHSGKCNLAFADGHVQSTDNAVRELLAKELKVSQ